MPVGVVTRSSKEGKPRRVPQRDEYIDDQGCDAELEGCGAELDGPQHQGRQSKYGDDDRTNPDFKDHLQLNAFSEAHHPEQLNRSPPCYRTMIKQNITLLFHNQFHPSSTSSPTPPS